jgi:uncharacterized lipoprotein YddW (UPF0748 family)
MMRCVWRLAVIVALVLGSGSAARGQVSYEEAMRRLKERQAARLQEGKQQTPTTGEAATATRPAGATAPTPRGVGENPPAAPREFRGVWVASVDNANWPSKAGLTQEEQRAEMIGILDKCAALNANAIVFQVRPCADALYPSELEPWSEYMTGTQGKAPEPAWDPLKEWIDESHKRGMELHAWFNPYRVKHAKSKSPVIDDLSIAKRHPEVVKSYGGYLWMDPGEDVAARHTLDVIADIVKRYDVDGVHTDDYYYPYQVREEGKLVEFPDDPSFQRYQAGGGKLSRNDWRRDNVNRLVERIYTTVKGIKPWVKVGYAPFGIWKSGVPAGIKGLSMYDALYADAKLWLNKGWLDYMSPQLYWKIGGDQDYVALYNWWVSENTARRHVWPGLSVGRHPVQEVENQIGLTRKSRGTTPGVILWSVNSVLKRQELYDALRRETYADAALVPASPWLAKVAPAAPAVTATKGLKGEVNVGLTAPEGERPAVYGIWARHGGKWSFRTAPGAASAATVGAGATGMAANSVVVTAVDRFGNESERVAVPVK